MNKTFLSLLIAFLSLIHSAPASALAVDTRICADDSLTVGYFNGVRTTREEALEALEYLRHRHGLHSEKGALMVYQLFYNTSQGFEDFVEVFEQRLNEQDGVLAGRFELFLEAWNGQGSKWDKLIKAAPALGGIMTGYLRWLDAKMLRLLSSLLSAPPSEIEQQAHRALIDRLLLEGRPLLLLAHSQGNLFANAAYAHARRTAPPHAVRVVHIAPASPKVSGPHTLADLDLVINGLRFAGSVPAINAVIPPYGSRPAGENGKTDLLGHGLIEIYLNPALDVSAHIDRQVREALAQLSPGRRTARSPLFTVAMTWDEGRSDMFVDLDLHIYEPGGRKVFQGSPQGNGGEMVLFKTQGTEHYLASCDDRHIPLGRYLIAVANYRGGQGRTATVQVDSALDGVLGTRMLVMGPETREYANTSFFSLDVGRDARTGRLTVRLVE